MASTETSTTRVSVQYERKLSDGNYGSEGLSMSWAVSYEDVGDLACDAAIVDARCQLIASALREAVLSQLATSEARNVAYQAARELNPPPPATAADGSSDLEDMPF
jgi:hypothetical protein